MGCHIVCFTVSGSCCRNIVAIGIVNCGCEENEIGKCGV